MFKFYSVSVISKFKYFILMRAWIIALIDMYVPSKTMRVKLKLYTIEQNKLYEFSVYVMISAVFF